MGLIRIGTSGWSYPTGKGTWNGLFYPPRPARGFDELRFYAEHFDTVEVNSTFYGQPRAEVTRTWVERTPSDFEFSVKLYQKFTHPKMFKEAALARAPGNDGALLELLAQVTRADIDEFRRGIDPIARAGRMGALLVQFPPSFTKDAVSTDYLTSLLRTFSHYPTAVELRHASWSTDLTGTLELLNGFGAAWVQIDEPKFRLSIQQNFLPNVRTFYYMRLHGRNAADWWRPETSEDRYNYLYSPAQLEPIVEMAGAAKSLVRKLYLYMNNHFAAKAVVNATMAKHQLGEPIAGTFPPAFIERYPEVQPFVIPATSRPSRTLF